MTVMAPTLSNIERTRRYLLESDLSEDSKDNLQALLDSAVVVANSRSVEEMSAALAGAVSAVSVYQVREAVRAPSAVKSVVDQHVAEMHDGAHCERPQTTKGQIFHLLNKPWPWLAVSVAIFSPHLPGIISQIAEIFSK